MSYENQDFTLHQMHNEVNPNCEYCAEKWDINSPEARVKTLPIPKGFVSAPRRGDGQHY